MPVTVKLLDLVGLKGSRRLWPEQFAALVAKLEEKPAVKAQYGVIADWCRENDEPELADVFSWVFNRAGVCVDRPGAKADVYTFYGLPDAVSDQYTGRYDCSTIPGCMSNLVIMLAEAREKAKKDLEALG